jgi:carboxypeptidase Q
MPTMKHRTFRFNNATETIDLDMMAKIREEGLNRSQIAPTLSYITEVIGPRLTGSSALKRANLWVADTMTKWGMANAHLEPWGPFGRGWKIDKFSIEMQSSNPFPIIAVPKAWSPAVRVKANLVAVNVASEADLANYKGKLKGKIVLDGAMRPLTAHFDAQGNRMSDVELDALSSAAAAPNRPRNPNTPPTDAPMTEEMRRRMAAFQLGPLKMQFYREEGVAVVLDAARGDGGTVFVQQASVATNTKNKSEKRAAPQSFEARGRIVPQIAVAAEHYNRLLRMVEAGESVQLTIDLRASDEVPDKGMVSNTIAEIPGTDKKDEVVMCGGHLDSWHGGTGATDDACGVAVGMEALRILKTLGVQPRRTIRFAAWTGEEQGIFGSSAYVTAHFGTKDKPTAEHANLAGYFNLDNGTGKVRGVWCQENEAVMPLFKEWLAPFNDLGAKTVTRRRTGGTDHLSFDAAGIPGFQFIQDTIEYDSRTHHSNMDTFDRIQIEDMKQAAVLMAAFLYNTAMREEKLPRKP